jgi:hypothetical protein
MRRSAIGVERGRTKGLVKLPTNEFVAFLCELRALVVNLFSSRNPPAPRREGLRQIDQIPHTEAFADFPRLRTSGRIKTAQQLFPAEPLYPGLPALAATITRRLCSIY